MDVWIRAIVIIVGSIIGSGGLWAYLQNRDSKKNATTRLLMGMAYDRITAMGLEYIERGSVTKDEYEELEKFFYKPYKALGGNGVAERVMRDVAALPFRPHNVHPQVFRNRENEGVISNVRVVARPDQADAG